MLLLCPHSHAAVESPPRSRAGGEGMTCIEPPRLTTYPTITSRILCAHTSTTRRRTHNYTASQRRFRRCDGCTAHVHAARGHRAARDASYSTLLAAAIAHCTHTHLVRDPSDGPHTHTHHKTHARSATISSGAQTTLRRFAKEKRSSHAKKAACQKLLATHPAMLIASGARALWPCA